MGTHVKTKNTVCADCLSWQERGRFSPRKHTMLSVIFRSCHYHAKLAVCTFLLFSFSVFSSAETISFYANSMSGSTSDNNEYTQLSGNAYIKTDSMELRADEIEMKGTDYRYIIATGNVNGTYTDGGFAFTCNNINYDRDTEVAVLEGTVSMDDTENDVQLEAEFIEYNQKTEIALIQIAVKIVQDESICTSAFALYRKELQILELSGSPKIVQGDDIFQAQEIIFNLDTEQITLVGKVHGTVTDSKDTDVKTETNDDDDVQPETENAQTDNNDEAKIEFENMQIDDSATNTTTEQTTKEEKTNE